MGWWIVIGLIAAAVIVWLKWGHEWYLKKMLFLHKIETDVKIAGKLVSDIGEIAGVADSIAHGGGEFFSRSTGNFSSAVG